MTVLRYASIYILIILVSLASAESEYCTPDPDEMTVELDQDGDWYNFTITSATCYVCAECGGMTGDVCCSLCSELAPIAEFSVNATCGIVPASFAFTDTSGGVNITSWYWDFGEGNTSVEEDPIFQYNMTGLFSVNHSATNEYGTGWENKSFLISIRPFGDTCAGGGGGYTMASDTSGAMFWTFGLLGVFALIIVGVVASRRKRKDDDYGYDDYYDR